MSGRPRSSSTTSTPARWSTTPRPRSSRVVRHPVAVQRGAQRGRDPVVVLDQQDVHVPPTPAVPVAEQRYPSETLWVAQGAGLWCPIRPSVPPCPEAPDDHRDSPMIRMAVGRQALRRPARAARHQPRGRRRPGGRGARPVRVRQVHAVPHDQPAGADRQRHDRGRRQGAARRGQGAGRAARRRRHGVPELQPLRAQDDPRERHPRPAQGAQDEQGRGREAGAGPAGAGRHRQPARQVPRPALRRPAAARRDRPRAGHEARR